MKKFNAKFTYPLLVASCTLPAFLLLGCASSVETAYVKEGDEIIALDENTVQEDNMAMITLEQSTTLSEQEPIEAAEEELPAPVVITSGNPEAYVEIVAETPETITEGGNSIHSLEEVVIEEEIVTEAAPIAPPEVPSLAEAIAPPPTDETLLFKTNSSIISSEDMDKLTKHADYLINTPSARLTINGHADKRGDIAYNLKLSDQRAQNIANLLIKMGVEASQLEINAFGDTQPAIDAGDWKANRRVEMHYEMPNILTKR